MIPTCILDHTIGIIVAVYTGISPASKKNKVDLGSAPRTSVSVFAPGSRAGLILLVCSFAPKISVIVLRALTPCSISQHGNLSNPLATTVHHTLSLLATVGRSILQSIQPISGKRWNIQRLPFGSHGPWRDTVKEQDRRIGRRPAMTPVPAVLSDS